MIKSFQSVRDTVRSIGTAIRASSEYSRAAGNRPSDVTSTGFIPL